MARIFWIWFKLGKKTVKFHKSSEWNKLKKKFTKVHSDSLRSWNFRFFSIMNYIQDIMIKFPKLVDKALWLIIVYTTSLGETPTVNTYCSRTNYHQFLLVFVKLFMCCPVHPCKHLIILNVTMGLTYARNIYIFTIYTVYLEGTYTEYLFSCILFPNIPCLCFSIRFDLTIVLMVSKIKGTKGNQHLTL